MADHKEAVKDFGSDIKTGTTDSILAGVFRTILSNLNIDPAAFNSLLEKYIIKTGVPNNIKEISSLRGNLKKELLKSVMSWRIFVKGLVFLNIIKFDIAFTLYHAIGKVTIHGRTVTLDPDSKDYELIKKSGHFVNIDTIDNIIHIKTTGKQGEFNYVIDINAKSGNVIVTDSNNTIVHLDSKTGKVNVMNNI